MIAFRLDAICSDDASRGALNDPMLFSHDGAEFVVATDGHRLLELPVGDVPLPADGYLPAPGNVAQSLTAIILRPTPSDAVPLDFAALRTFIHKQTCEYCCDRRDPAYVYIGGVLFNAHKFEPMVSHLSDTGKVRWHQAGAKLQATIDGGEWRFVVMPLKDEGDNKYAPRFEIAGVAL